MDVRLRAMSSGGGGLQFGGVWTGIIVTQIALTTTLPFVTSFIRDDYVKQRDTPAGFAAEEFLTAISRSIAPTARRPARTRCGRRAPRDSRRAIERSPIDSSQSPA